MPETTTVKLSKPIMRGDKAINEVTVRAATLGDMLVADHVSGERTKEVAIYCTIAGLDIPTFSQLTPGDYLRIVDAADALSGNELAPAREAAGAMQPD